MDHSQKPLVLIFQGLPGTGKNFVADRIVDHLYKLGGSSSFVHKYIGRRDFPEDNLVSKYGVSIDVFFSLFMNFLTLFNNVIQQKLKANIEKAIKNCPRSLFIFDEVDKMPSGIFDHISHLLDHHRHIDGVNYRESTFIFLSNSGGEFEFQSNYLLRSLNLIFFF